MENDKLFAARINDLVARVRRNQMVCSTGFLDPHEQQRFLDAVKNETDIRVALIGGYKGAERRVGMILPGFASEDDLLPPVHLLIITSTGDFSKIKHKDILGTVLSLGIKRSNIGDILVLDDAAQLIVLKDMAAFITQNLVEIRNQPVTVVTAELADIIKPEQRVKEIKTTVSSLRLDSIASAAFGMSRSKILPYIKGEKVMVNWRIITKPAQVIEPGSTITVRGRGRARLEEVQGKSQKNRIRIKIFKFL